MFIMNHKHRDTSFLYNREDYDYDMGPHFLTWFNLNPSMDK